MKTVSDTSKLPKRIFYILIAEKKSNFHKLLSAMLATEPNLFPDIQFSIERITHPIQLNSTSFAGYDLVFMEDIYLIDLVSQQKKTPREQIPQNMILLLNGHFTGENIQKLKEAIYGNLLNLSGHISLVNYTYDLIRLLLIDFIKVRLRSHEKSLS